jgi:hypothetical protein
MGYLVQNLGYGYATAMAPRFNSSFLRKQETSGNAWGIPVR